MTLTQAAFWTKRLFILTVILIILGIIAKVGYDIWYQHYLASLPPVEEKPDLKFGVLPAVQFPSSSISTSNFSYSIDTQNGDLPSEPKIIKVYFIPQQSVTLLSPDKATTLAQSLGFFNGPQIISPNEYHYTDNSKNLLNINLPTGNFHFQRAASSSAQLTSHSETPTSQPTVSQSQNDQLVSNFRDYLASKNLLADDLMAGRTNVVATGFANSPSGTFLVAIWPKDFDNLPIVTSSQDKSLVYATLTNLTSESDRFSAVNYIHWPVDATTFATYPLKSAGQAFQDLRSGFGYVTLEPVKPQVSISKVYLAYIEVTDYTPYLQPVYVFEGEHFQALVAAISTK